MPNAVAGGALLGLALLSDAYGMAEAPGGGRAALVTLYVAGAFLAARAVTRRHQPIALGVAAWLLALVLAHGVDQAGTDDVAAGFQRQADYCARVHDMRATTAAAIGHEVAAIAGPDIAARAEPYIAEQMGDTDCPAVPR